ncbi:MAG: LCP family protein [Clostridia bacterium]|nr:LCP family protein [Clostridia bacterium]
MKKLKSNASINNFLVIVGGVAFGLVLVFTIICVDLLSDMNLISFDRNKDYQLPSEFVDVVDEPDKQVAIDTLNELRDVNDLSSALKGWAENNTENSFMRSENVINFLLIGLDASNNNSDAIIIASLNKEQKKIYLTSVFRDSYTYMNTAFGDKYAKINACYANGGAEKLVETVENNFKIKIDHYVSVNFDSFSSIVDALGGVKLDVKQYEAQAVMKEIKGDCPYGEGVILNGEQALGFCRIRNCDVDADVSRTRRQRQFLNSLIDEAKNISISQITPLLNTVLKYIKTDCSVKEIISLGTGAVSNKWYNYELESAAIPSEEHRLDYRGSSWVWIVDYPAAAKDLQETIYGKTNIVLEEDRVSVIDIMKNSQNTGTAAP